jgi:hypothetical protein
VISFKAMLADRRRRQRGSVLSALLIIVALLSILIGAVMTELTGSFLASRTLMTRMEREATLTSAVELGIHQLGTGAVPPVCVRDSRGPWFVTLNGNPAAVTQSCTSIVPDLATNLAPGAFMFDGVHDTVGGRNRYLVEDRSGRLYAYPFSSAAPSWSIPTGGVPSAPPTTMLDPGGWVDLLVPNMKSGSSCGRHCVSVFDDRGRTPTFRCDLRAAAPVINSPATELTDGSRANFPGYVFYGDPLGTSSGIHVANVSPGAGCAAVQDDVTGSPMAGPPLVLQGATTSNGNATTVSDEIFVLVSDAGRTSLQRWRYSETTSRDDEGNNNSNSLSLVSSLSLTAAVGGLAVGYGVSSYTPTSGRTLMLVVAGASGRMAIVNIMVGSRHTYANPRLGPTFALPTAVGRPPYWCHCPGQDLIGIGGTNGVMYLLSTGLAIVATYDGAPDGHPAINTTPAADVNGDWYFGADDGFVYDVELRSSGSQMFKAARFGPGGAIRSSPMVGGPADGCASGPCIYFGSASGGSFFAKLGSIRITDLRACVSSAFGSTSCVANPRLWARVEVGSPSLVGARGVYVRGWSYYSP